VNRGTGVRRLGPDDRAAARRALRLISQVFEEPPATLSDSYLAALLARPDFWLVAALVQDEPIGGLTAHTLPMTRRETSELFIYDLAVHPPHQRGGVGRALVQALREEAARQGIVVSFVPADNEDEHALEFYRAIGGAPAPVTIFTFGAA
jgi:aminoglycoside 3-N-acetyltransferase I